MDLKDYKGQYVVLFFYPMDFTFVCPQSETDGAERGPKWRHIAASVRGRIYGQHTDVHRLPSTGSQRLLESQRPSQTESRSQENASLFGTAYPQAQSSRPVRRHQAGSQWYRFLFLQQVLRPTFRRVS